MPHKSLINFAEQLEKQGELVRIKQHVDPKLEITEICDRMSKTGNGGKALLFENNGTEFPVFINMMGSKKRLCAALGVAELDEFGHEIEALFKQLTSPRKGLAAKLKALPLLNSIASWMPRKVSGRGACQQVVMEEPNLSKLPILQCWPHDGGRFITFPMVITKDPCTNTRNVGMYRMQVLDDTTTGMHWHKHKTGARHYQEYKKQGTLMPVSVALGGDPALTFSATAPLPDNIDEYMLAGFIRKKRVEMVKCLTNDLEVPADSDIIIEGYVDPREDLAWEGPFGDHTGFYSLADWYPRFHVTCITHKRGAVYPATIVGVPPMEDAWIAKATERIFVAPIKMTVLPEMIDMDMPWAGVAHNLVLASIEKTFAGQGPKSMNALWGAGQMMFNKILVTVDGKVDVHDYLDVAKHISKHTNPLEDIHIGKGPLDVLDHASQKFAFGGKLFIDATRKHAEEKGEDKEYSTVIDIAKIKEKYSTIYEVNDSLLAVGVSVVVISFKKTEGSSLSELLLDMALSGLCKVKCIIGTDHNVEIQDIETTLWVVMNNIDPWRDTCIEQQNGIFLVDASRKTASADKFERSWPNVVTMDNRTIQTIDQKWDSLGLGNMIPSPSLKYRKLVWNDAATSE